VIGGRRQKRKVKRTPSSASVGLEQRFFSAVEKQEMIRPGDRVGVAVSGGADSVALLLLLYELSGDLGIVLSIVHFNHKLRGKASDADEKFVAKLAAKLGLEFHTASAHVAKKAKLEKSNLEDAARRARYDYFRSLVESGVCGSIAVAHTADDQAETVLAHILRGTGLAGLGGIHPTTDVVIRPLLNCRRSELRQFLRTRKQSWREDASNHDVSRQRARMRKKLLPLLEREFQAASIEHIANLSALAREDEALLEAVAQDRFDGLAKHEKETTTFSCDAIVSPFSRSAGEAAQTALSRRLIRMTFSGLQKKPGQLLTTHVEAVRELAKKGENGKALQLPGAVEVRREQDKLVFRSSETSREHATRSTSHEYEYKIDLVDERAELLVPELQCVFRLRVIDWPRKRGETSMDGPVLDRDRLRFPLLLRNWRPGDRLCPCGHRSAHKLKRLLNEKRVSRWERNGWPVLVSGDVLVWARGFPVAAEFAADEGTRAGTVIVEEKI
jgi:tRNA(Ile)-lysidine synthase